MRILAVDDDLDNLELIREYLKDHHEITTENNPKKALTLLLNASRPFELILLDWTMPEIDGLELLGMLKNEKKYQHYSDTPVIFQTARSMEKDFIDVLSEGATQYLTKPFSEEKLLAVVQSTELQNKKYSDFKKDIELEIEQIKDYAFNTIAKEKKKISLDLKTHKVINDFFMKSLDCQQHTDLSKLLLDSLNKFEFDSAKEPNEPDENKKLRCSLFLASDEEVNLSDRGISSVMDKIILTKALQSDDIIQKGSYTALSSKNKLIAILLRNTPKNIHENKKAVNIITVLLEMFEGRLKHFEYELNNKRREHQIEQIVSLCCKEIENIKTSFQEFKNKQTINLKKTNSKIKELTDNNDKKQVEMRDIVFNFSEKLTQQFLYCNIIDQIFFNNIQKLKQLFLEKPDRDRNKSNLSIKYKEMDHLISKLINEDKTDMVDV